MKVWDRTGIELVTPGSAVRLASVARHVTDCATRSHRGHNGEHFCEIILNLELKFKRCFLKIFPKGGAIPRYSLNNLSRAPLDDTFY